nr:hypothetical protein KXZ65_17510 [Pectobacterium sp. PL152]
MDGANQVGILRQHLKLDDVIFSQNRDCLIGGIIITVFIHRDIIHHQTIPFPNGIKAERTPNRQRHTILTDVKAVDQNQRSILFIEIKIDVIFLSDFLIFCVELYLSLTYQRLSV